MSTTITNVTATDTITQELTPVSQQADNPNSIMEVQDNDSQSNVTNERTLTLREEKQKLEDESDFIIDKRMRRDLNGNELFCYSPLVGILLGGLSMLPGLVAVLGGRSCKGIASKKIDNICLLGIAGSFGFTIAGLVLSKIGGHMMDTHENQLKTRESEIRSRICAINKELESIQLVG